MPYDARTIKELKDSAETTPMAIQLEVNAEVFFVIHNLLWTSCQDSLRETDKAELYKLWKETVHQMSLIELRQGEGIYMDQQVKMLKEAYDIETHYIEDQIFTSDIDPKLSKKLNRRGNQFDPEAMTRFFNQTVWPAASYGKKGNQKKPMAYIIAGQPGSGKTRMSSIVIEEYGDNIIQSMSDNFRGFVPNYKEILEKYGHYCCFSPSREQFFSDLTLHRAAEGKFHILQEGSLLNVQHTLASISYLKNQGYSICVMFRACPKKESWRAIHQMYLQQRLKAPVISRIISKEQHDNACRSFLSAVTALVDQNAADRIIIKSPKGLLYDSDDMPPDSIHEILEKRMIKK